MLIIVGVDAGRYSYNGGGGRVCTLPVVFSAGTCSTNPFPCSPFFLFSEKMKQSCLRCVRVKRKCVPSSIEGVCDNCLSRQTKKSKSVIDKDPSLWARCSYNPSFHPGHRTDLKCARERPPTKLVVRKTSSKLVRVFI